MEQKHTIVDLHAVFGELQELARRDPIGTYTRAGYPHRLKKQGKWLAGLCPFHADTEPSFRIDPNGRWYCFGACRTGGDLCDLYARLRRCSQSQAARELAALFNLSVPDEPSPTSAKQRVTRRDLPSPQVVAALQAALWKNAAALRFLREERCLSEQTIKAARLGFYQGRYAIPVFTETGEVADVRLYAPDGSPKMQAWREGTGGARLYFPPDWRPLVPGDTLIISEGELDCLLLSDLGFRAFTNTNGAAAWPQDANLDLRGVTVILASDNDAAGRQRNEMLTRWCREHGASAVYAVTWPQDAPAGFDVTDLARQHAPDRERMAEAIGRLLADAVPAATSPSLPLSPVEEVAKLLGETTWLWKGWLPCGYVTVLAGEPGVGKSLLALYLCKVAVTGERWPDGQDNESPVVAALFADAEGCQALTAQRAANFGVPPQSIFLPGTNGLDRLILNDAEQVAAVREAVRERGIGVVVVDSLRSALSSGLDENDARLQSILGAWADLARDENIAILLVHHFRKKAQGEDELSLDRLRGSSAISAFARVVITLDKPNPHEPAARLAVLKSNLAERPKPLGLRITTQGLLEFDAKAPEPPRRDTATELAEDFLLAELEHKPRPASEIRELALQHGFSRKTLYRARERLGIVVVPDPSDPTGRSRLWSLPAPER